MRQLFPLFFILVLNACSSPQLPRDTRTSNQTINYQDGMVWWDSLDAYSDMLSMETFGETDAGYPLHLAVLSSEHIALDDIASSGKTVVLINNAIHPGEPDGVEASMALYREICHKRDQRMKSLVVVSIPFYNIGGSLERNSSSRANQQGPAEYGFRGNGQNLDLNRDFVKCDSRNALSFARLIQLLDPDLYLETHVSNGADYRYTMTYLPTQTDKLGYGLGEYMQDKLIPYMTSAMASDQDEMTPYVNVHGGPLEDAFAAFYDSPRYSTGMVGLHQTIGLLTETHMLKPFDQRVASTLRFMDHLLNFCVQDRALIQSHRTKAKKEVAQTEDFPLDWAIDSSRYDSFKFKAYAYDYRPSEVSGLPRLYYDRSKPLDKAMRYYAYMKPTNLRHKPQAYVIKAGMHELLDRLRANGVVTRPVTRDTSIAVISYLIEDLETSRVPFEKHYYHYNTKFRRDTLELTVRQNDVLIPMGTDKDRFLLEVLEPDAPDSYFNWNFFDAFLQQKEWFSPYVFEDTAAEILKNRPGLKQALEAKKQSDPSFAQNAAAQLFWVYKRSPHYEHSHMRLPVYRIE